MGKTIDLDAFLAEQNAEAGSVRFKGKDYALPAEIPWHVVVKAQEMDGTDVSLGQVGEVVAGLVGKDSWEAMIADGLGLKSALHLMNGILEQVMEGVPAEQGDPKAAMEKAASRSPSRTPRKTSGSPAPTSGGNIRLATGS